VLFPAKFAEPVRSYDVHIYFFHTDEKQVETARELREQILQLFPEVVVYKLWDRPIGPHPVGMFEVDLKQPAHFARFLPWFNVNRRGLSALVHPNTGFPFLDHTRNAMWIGSLFPLNTSCLKSEDPKYGL
jgi:DOPA 4,5-dioxygenase